jgi:hypothetical protein
MHRRSYRKLLVFNAEAQAVGAGVPGPLPRVNGFLGGSSERNRSRDSANLLGLWEAFAGLYRRGIN